MGGKTKDQLLEELSEVQKMLGERTGTQSQIIKRFQTLIENEGQRDCAYALSGRDSSQTA
jgi:hypothetical protein